jgi:hypothetical protein
VNLALAFGLIPRHHAPVCTDSFGARKPSQGISLLYIKCLSNPFHPFYWPSNAALHILVSDVYKYN